MSDNAPERITTYVDDPSIDPNIYTANLTRKVEYVRADLLAAMVEKARRDAYEQSCSIVNMLAAQAYIALAHSSVHIYATPVKRLEDIYAESIRALLDQNGKGA